MPFVGNGEVDQTDPVRELSISLEWFMIDNYLAPIIVTNKAP